MEVKCIAKKQNNVHIKDKVFIGFTVNLYFNTAKCQNIANFKSIYVNKRLSVVYSRKY